MLFILLFSISFCSGFPAVQGELEAVCSAGMTVLKNQNASAARIKVTGRLSGNSNLQHQSCVLKMDKPEGYLHVKAKRDDNYTGFLNISLYEAGGSVLLGRVNVSKPTHVWSTLTLYPPSSNQAFGEKYMSISGTSGVSFTVELAQRPSEMTLNTPQTVTIDSTNAIVFQFNSPKGISEKQLDITVTSSSNVPAYLKVSQTRLDVQENIDVIDYKKASLRLSFAKKGRITLSTASVPPLTDSTSIWYIGIALKNATGSLRSGESKDVTLELSQSFDYGYAAPICTLFFASLGVGVIVSIIALVLFKDPLDATDTANKGVGDQKSPPDNQRSPSDKSRPSDNQDMRSPSDNQGRPSDNQRSPFDNQGSPSDNQRSPSDNQGSPSDNQGSPSNNQGRPSDNQGSPSDNQGSPSDNQGRPSDNQGSPSNNDEPNKCKKVWTFIKAMFKVAFNYWFSDGPKTFSYATGIAGFVLMIGAGQFVIANWYIMILEGDRDNCYYNDFCYRVDRLSSYDIPFDLMISNLAYIIHALILTLCVWYMETELFLYCEKLESQSVSEKNDSKEGKDKRESQTDQAQSQCTPENECKSERERRYQKQSQIQSPSPSQIPSPSPSKSQIPSQGQSPSQSQIPSKITSQSQSPSKITSQSQSQIQRRDEDQIQIQIQLFSLPDDAIVCPSINPHLLEGVIPMHTIKPKKKSELRIRARKKKYSLSIGYAFAWALLFEGLFSTLYHLCPSRFTFQFDSAFMFVIAGLTVMILYNGIEEDKCLSESSKKVKFPVGALNFFFYFIVPLFIFNYFGTLYHSESGLHKVLQGFFFAFLLVWWVVVFLWALYKLHIRQGVFTTEENPAEKKNHYWNLFYFIIGGFVAPLVLFFVFFFKKDLSQAFLFTCIVVSVTAVCAKTKIVQKLVALCMCDCERPSRKEFFQACYIIITVVVLGVAVYFLGDGLYISRRPYAGTRNGVSLVAFRL